MTAHAAQDLGLMLHHLLADLDPARWRDEKAERLEAAFADFREDVEAALNDWSTEQRLEAVRLRLSEIQDVVGARLPSADDVKGRWMEFRDEIHPAYEGLADALKTAHMELPSVRPTNYARSFFHALAAVVAVLFVEYSPWWLVITIPVTLAAFFWFLEVMRRVSDAWNEFLMRAFDLIAHPHERYRVNSSTWFATALSLLALTHQPLVGAAAVTVLGFGDPAAGLVGRKLGRTKLVNGRSLEGTITFAVVSFAMVFGVLSLWHADVAMASRLLICGVAAIVGALVELFSRRVDDNFAIPVVVGLAVWGLMFLL